MSQENQVPVNLSELLLSNSLPVLKHMLNPSINGVVKENFEIIDVIPMERPNNTANTTVIISIARDPVAMEDFGDLEPEDKITKEVRYYRPTVQEVIDLLIPDGITTNTTPSTITQLNNLVDDFDLVIEANSIIIEAGTDELKLTVKDPNNLKWSGSGIVKLIRNIVG